MRVIRTLTFSILFVSLSLGGLVACSSKAKVEANQAKESLDKAKNEDIKKLEKTAQTGMAKTPGLVRCKNKSDERLLELRPKGSGCELAYTKAGQESVVASAQNGQAHCQATLDKIKSRLESAGFTCP